MTELKLGSYEQIGKKVEAVMASTKVERQLAKIEPVTSYVVRRDGTVEAIRR